MKRLDYKFINEAEERDERKVSLKELYNSLTDNEKFGISFGMFPSKVIDRNLSRKKISKLVDMAQAETKKQY